MEKKIYIYTDGACRGNPGPGGWGALLVYGKRREEVGGAEMDTTNNRMELTAAIGALARIKLGYSIYLVTDSQYLNNGVTQWLDNWKKRNWRNSEGKPIKNKDLWEQIDQLIQQHKIHWKWVRGHSGHPGNERADQIANEHIDKMLGQDSG